MSNAKLIRRSFGGACLVGALLMLALGDTKPAPGANQLGFAIYWLGCFALAVGAMGAAILDLGAVRREAREAQKSLFEDTLINIQTEKQRRKSGDQTQERNEP